MSIMSAMQDVYSRLGHFGYIVPEKRTAAQNEAHHRAMAGVQRFSAVGPSAPTTPVKVMLTDWWKHPDAVADMGMAFPGFHQLTGSCVGVSAGDAICTLSCVQRTVAANPTKAFIPWWGFSYGRTRMHEGDRGRGEGAVDSVMGQTLQDDGSFAITEPGLPTFKSDDGLYLTSQLELQWSDGAAIPQNFTALAKTRLLRGKAVCNSTQDIKAAVTNGYPVLDGCSMFCQRGSIKGSGADAYVGGTYDGSGGHSTCFLGYWDHPSDGPLYLYSNQWPTQTYPADPAGAGRCCVWLAEKTVERLFTQLGGRGGETMALSSQDWFPAQPSVIDWAMA